MCRRLIERYKYLIPLGSSPVLKKLLHTLICAGGVALSLLIAFVGVRLLGLTPYAVLSGSMEPEYPVGSLIYVASVEPEEVSIGDAITFELGSGTLVTHQVYDVDQANRQFNTQGIANKTGDGEIVHDAQPVPYERLVGKPVLCIPLPWLSQQPAHGAGWSLHHRGGRPADARRGDRHRAHRALRGRSHSIGSHMRR